MSFQLTRTHTSVVLAATTIAASLVVIPTLAEGNATTSDAFCNALSGQKVASLLNTIRSWRATQPRPRATLRLPP